MSSGQAATPAGAAGFAGLVDRARRAKVRSGRDVDAGVAAERGDGFVLVDEELAWLAAAADAAESIGAERLVATMRGLILGVDIAARRIDEAAEGGAGVVVTGADALAVYGGECVCEDEGAEGVSPADTPRLFDRSAWSRRTVPVVRAGAISESADAGAGGTAYAVLGGVAGNSSLTSALARETRGALGGVSDREGD